MTLRTTSFKNVTKEQKTEGQIMLCVVIELIYYYVQKGAEDICMSRLA